MWRRSHGEEGPQCGGEATVSRLATVRRRSHSEEEQPQCGGGATVKSSGQCGATVRKSGLSAEEEPQ